MRMYTFSPPFPEGAFNRCIVQVEPMIAMLVTDIRKWAQGSAKDVIPAQAGMTIGYVLFSE